MGIIVLVSLLISVATFGFARHGLKKNGRTCQELKAEIERLSKMLETLVQKKTVGGK